jgi:peptidyl-prolyl cis-trans isomerase B (cyclophilin B)
VKEGAAVSQAAKSAPKAAADEVAVMETTKGKMVVEFWDKDAPQTVANFKKLSRQGFFDGTGFHRIIKNFMIQGGDPKSKNPNAPDLGTGDPGYKINDEFNAHQHVKGVLSMANSGTPNSAGSQFFIMHGANAGLDGKYTAFGHLIEGMDVLDAIANTPVGPNQMMGGEPSKPKEWTTLKSVKIVSKTAYLASKTGRSASDAAKAGMGGAAGAAMKAGETKAGQAAGEAKTAADSAATTIPGK